MAKKKRRLNKKLAVILTLVVVPLLVVAAVIVVRMKFRDPEPFYVTAQEQIAEATELEAAHRAEASGLADPEEAYNRFQELNAETVDELRGDAMENLQQAFRFSRARHDLKKEVLREMAALYEQMNDRGAASAVWRRTLEFYPAYVEAKITLVRSSYEIATMISAITSLWSDVRKGSEELMALESEADYADLVGAEGHLMKAHALIELVRSDLEVDPEGAMEEAETLLAAAAFLEKSSVWRLNLEAQLAVVRADRSDDTQEQEELQARAVVAVYREAISQQPDDPEAYLNFWQGHYRRVVIPDLRQKYLASRRGRAIANRQARLASVDPEAQEEADRLAAEADRLEAEYEALYEECLNEAEGMVARFPDYGEFYLAKATLYEMRTQLVSDLDAMVTLYEQAVATDESNARWRAILAGLYFLRAVNTDASGEDLIGSFDLLRSALYSPDALVGEGPYFREKNNRITILSQLVEVSSARAVLGGSGRDRYLEIAENSLAELQGLVGADTARSRIAMGVLALAKGDVDEGIKQLYDADQEKETQGIHDYRLKRRLYVALRETPQKALAVRYGAAALRGDLRSSQMFLELLEILADLRDVQSSRDLLGEISIFEEIFSLEGEERERMLRYQATALMRLRDEASMDQAREILASLDGEDFDLRLLRVRSLEEAKARIAALEALAKDFPEAPELVLPLYEYYLSVGGEDPSAYDRARELIEGALASAPENYDFLQMKRVLAEPDPGAVSQEQRLTLALATAEGLSDAYERERRLGQLYGNYGRLAASQGDTDKVAGHWIRARQHYLAANAEKAEVDLLDRAFKASLQLQDWPEAETLMEQVRLLDEFAGLALEGDLYVAQGQWSQAAFALEEYLKDRPISIPRRLALARVYMRLERGADAIFQARQAVGLHHSNVEAHRWLALFLDQENRGLGLEEIGAQRIQEVLQSVNLVLNANPTGPGMLQLLATYNPLMMRYVGEELGSANGMAAERRAELEDYVAGLYDRAVVGSTYLINREPGNVSHRQLLANVHEQYMQLVGDEAKQASMRNQIEQVYQEGVAANPDSAPMRAAYSAYLQRTGRGEEALEALRALATNATGEQQQSARIRLARLLVEQGAYGQAQSELESVLADDGQNRTAMFMLAGVMRLQKKPEAALELYEKLRAIEDAENLVSAHFEVLLQLGRTPEAAGLLEEAIGKYTGTTSVLMMEARLAEHEARYKEAIAKADLVIEASPLNTEAYLLKARGLRYDQRFQEAIDCLRDLRGMQKGESVLGWDLISSLYWTNARYDTAIEELQRVLVLYPQHINARQQLIRYLGQRQAWGKLEKLYGETLAMYPGSVDLHIRAAESLMGNGAALLRSGQRGPAATQYAKAENLLKVSRQLSSGAGHSMQDVFNAHIRLLLQRGQYQKVLDMIDAESVPEQVRNLPQILLHRVEALRRLERPEEALATFEKTLELTAGDDQLNDVVLRSVGRVGDLEVILSWAEETRQRRPDWGSIHELLAGIYKAKREHEKEEASYLAAIEHVKELQRKNRLKLSLAMHYGMRGERDQSITVYREILETAPDNAAVLNNLAYTLLEVEGHETEAAEMAQRAYNQAKTNPDVMDTYVMALLRTGECREAELLAKQAIQSQQRRGNVVPAEYYFRLGEALHCSGDNYNAERELQTALRQIEQGVAEGDAEMLKAQVEALFSSLYETTSPE